MNIVTGVVEEIYIQEGMTMGKVNVRGAFLKVPLTFLMEARVGDVIVIESGVAISKNREERPTETERGKHVSGNSW